MRIKPPSRKHIIRARQRLENFQWWLEDKAPKKKGRLGQLNKANGKNKRLSEFQVMVTSMEHEPRF